MNLKIFREFNTFFVQYHILISRIFWNFIANRVEIMEILFHIFLTLKLYEMRWYHIKLDEVMYLK